MLNPIEIFFKIMLYFIAFWALRDNNIKISNNFEDWIVIVGGFIGGTLVGLDGFQLGDWMFE